MTDLIDVTDATFETEVVHESAVRPVVVDLWAPWCGPCRTLGPILEKVIGATAGKVRLVKVNTDENPGISQQFRVQSIPAVYAVKDRAIVDSFIGAVPEWEVQQFVDRLLPTEAESEVDALIRAGDEASMRKALDLAPADERVVIGLADLLVDTGRSEEALGLLERIPESPETRRISAAARLGSDGTDATEDVEATLRDLLTRVKDDEDARQRYVDLLEVMGPDDPRTSEFRRRLTTALY